MRSKTCARACTGSARPEAATALHAIWSSWNTGERLNFRGDFYSHTLMTPFFSPGPNPWGPPKVYLAAVGELSDGMTVYAIDQSSGALSKLKSYPTGKKPNWVEFLSLP